MLSVTPITTTAPTITLTALTRSMVDATCIGFEHGMLCYCESTR
jgi:hypothetical protein